MDRTDTVTKMVAILLFIALLAYIGVYVFRAASDTLQTTPAITMSVTDSTSATGIIIRSEQVIESAQSYIDITAREGSKVAVNSVVAVAYGNESALERSNRMHELETQIEYIQARLSDVSSSDDLTRRSGNILSAIRVISSVVSRHDFSELDSQSVDLTSLLFKDQGYSASESELQALKAELSSLRNSSSRDTKDIITESGGIFTSIVDGFEHLTLSDISGYGPERLLSLIKNGGQRSENAIGKVVTSSFWYYVAVMDQSHATALAAADTVALDFGRYYSGVISAQIESVGNDVDGQSVVIFRSGQSLADTLALRQVSADIVISEITGVRVPLKALHTDEETGRSYVYTVTGLQIEKKYVEIVYTTEDYYLVSSTGASALRAGNEIIVSGKDVYDGKIIG